MTLSCARGSLCSAYHKSWCPFCLPCCCVTLLQIPFLCVLSCITPTTSSHRYGSLIMRHRLVYKISIQEIIRKCSLAQFQWKGRGGKQTELDIGRSTVAPAIASVHPMESLEGGTPLHSCPKLEKGYWFTTEIQLCQAALQLRPYPKKVDRWGLSNSKTKRSWMSKTYSTCPVYSIKASTRRCLLCSGSMEEKMEPGNLVWAFLVLP